MAKNQQSERFISSIILLIKEGRVRSKRAIALALGVPPSMITDITKNKQGISNIHLRKFSELYGINYGYLIGESEIIKAEDALSSCIEIENTITIPKDAYDALIYKIKDLERRLNDEGDNKERTGSCG